MINNFKSLELVIDVIINKECSTTQKVLQQNSTTVLTQQETWDCLKNERYIYIHL
jgi:hypothetical protein